MRQKRLTDIRVVTTSLLVSVGDVVFNLTVGLLTGSAVMFSQALQGLSDFTTAAVLFTGVRRARRPADARHPLGYGRELYFWVLLAGIMMFLGTGGVSLYLGYQQLVTPEPLAYTWLALVMLSFGLVTNGYSFGLSLRRLSNSSGGQRWWQELMNSSLIETKATLLVDFMGTLAAVFGLLALVIYSLTGYAVFDGLGAIVIGLSMMLASLLLLHDVKDLIVGKAVDPFTMQRITAAVHSVEHVREVLDLRTVYLGSSKMLVLVEVHLDPKLKTREIEVIMDTIKAAIKTNIPEVDTIQVEVETPE